eukprot:m.318999 g.318999  ORF g.318999 m.318999 type:complete len:500 (-) comp20296_c0_seq2:505-2004(-)
MASTKMTEFFVLFFFVAALCSPQQVRGATAPIAVTSGDQELSLQLVQIVFRHGDRAPVSPVPAFPPAKWPRGIGRLTKLGMQQQFAAGYLYREMYQYFVGSTYNISFVQVQSTDVDRTLDSVECQLAGWFPLNNSERIFPNIYPGVVAPLWQPIPIHTVPTSEDSLLRAYDDGSCPVYTALKHDLPNQPNYAEKNNATAPVALCQALLQTDSCTNSELIANVATRTELPSMSLYDVWKVADALYVRSVQDPPVPVPAWASPEVIDYLNVLSAWGMYDMWSTPTMRRLTGGPLIKQILENVNSKYDASGKLNTTQSTAAGYRLYLYSSHDTTVSALLTALSATHFGLQFSPPYASGLIIELWSNNDKSSAELRIRFQHGLNLNQPGQANITNLTLSGCNYSCPLDKFASITAPVIPANWTQECGVGSAATTQHQGMSTGGTVALTVFAVLAVQVALYGVTKAIQSRRHRQYRATKNYNLMGVTDDKDFNVDIDEVSDIEE